VAKSGYSKEGIEKIHGEQLDSLCLAKIQTGYALLYYNKAGILPLHQAARVRRSSCSNGRKHILYFENELYMFINYSLVILKTLHQHLNPYEVILIESNVTLFSLCMTHPSTPLAVTACNHLTHRFHLNII
jgi:hypothetical protein